MGWTFATTTAGKIIYLRASFESHPGQYGVPIPPRAKILNLEEFRNYIANVPSVFQDEEPTLFMEVNESYMGEPNIRRISQKNLGIFVPLVVITNLMYYLEPEKLSLPRDAHAALYERMNRLIMRNRDVVRSVAGLP